MKDEQDFAVADLVTQIRVANRAYYDNDAPTIGDVEYDKLLMELRKIDPEHPVLDEIGNPTFGQKHEHLDIMGSLAKCHTAEEVVTKFKGQEVTMMPKVDGCSLSLLYIHGVLSRAVTRGNGKIGEIVTANAARILNVPDTIAFKEPIEVRGEAYISKEDFYGIMDQPGYAGHEEGLKNPRNAAAGALRQKDPALTAKRKLKFVAYKALYIEHIYETQTETIDYLTHLGFLAVNTWTHATEHIALTEQIIEQIRHYSAPYETDGVVIMLSDLAKFEDQGYSGKCPKGALAYKFETEKETSKVLDIEWETSRTGKIKPVAVIEPTEICGSTVARITMNNYQWLLEHNVAIGDKVLFEKANEIIPHLLEVLERAEDRNRSVPVTCPSCSNYVDYIEGETDLMCHNVECPAQAIKLIQFILETLQIKGIGETTVEKLVSNGFIDSPWDVFLLNEDALVREGFGPGESKNMVEAVKDIKAPAERILAALGIEGWGERMFEKLFESSQMHGNDWIPVLLELSADDVSILPEMWNAIENMGKIRAKQLIDGLRSKSSLLSGLLDQVSLVSASKQGHLAGATYCITGTLSRPRNQIKDDIKEAGGVVKDSITKTLDYLVVGKNSGSKLKKAEDAGVVVISEEELYIQMEG